MKACPGGSDSENSYVRLYALSFRVSGLVLSITTRLLSQLATHVGKRRRWLVADQHVLPAFDLHDFSWLFYLPSSGLSLLAESVSETCMGRNQ